MELKSGTYLQGDKYRIERSLGQGGFGITYLAEHELAGRMVCIKEFFPKSFYNRDADSSHVSLGSQGSAEMMDAYKQKFLKEARTIARLDHQNIIHIHDVFQENGTAYYVMEYIEGESLQDIVRRRGALTTEEALALMNPVIDAVGYIHDRRIMHLDIKPGNIMVRKEDGRPILIDFGLSKQYDEEGNQTSSTPVGISHGFAPIEQYQMGGVSAFSPQTDIYSLGATLYYLVSGTVPPQAAIVANEGMPELPATISANVRTAIEKAMEFRSKQRPESIAKLKQLLGSNATATVSVPASAQPSADTVIDIVADNSATQIDGGATQIDVPKDDATQIDGGSETAIEPKPSMATATAPVANAKAVQQPKVQSTSTASSTPAYRSAIQKEPEKKSKWWLWLLLLIVAGVVAVIVLNANGGYGDTYYNDYGYGGTYYESYEYCGEAEIYAAEIYEPEVYEPEQTVVESEPVQAPAPVPTPVPDPVLRLTSNSRVTTEYSGTNGTIRYTLENPISGVNISVSDNANWLTTSVSGSTISYTASANESQSSRTATITVRYGNQSFEVVITQNGKPAPTTGTANGHNWVDLGLHSGLKWATCNVGASNPGDYGNYYAWGETSTNSSYDTNNCSTWNQYIGDIAGTSRDAARQNWGGSWRMPRWSDFQELLDNCTWTWTTQNEHFGYRVTGPNGNSIFLPAAGVRDGSSSDDVGSYGLYWSSMPYESSTVQASYLCFSSGNHYMYGNFRCRGQSVRPVLD